MPDVRKLTLAFAAGRLVYASGLLFATGALGDPWLGSGARSPAAQVALRGLGGRDLAASLALFDAARRGGTTRPWLAVCAAGDLGDAAATALAGGGIPRSGQGKGVAVGLVTGAAGLALARLSSD